MFGGAEVDWIRYFRNDDEAPAVWFSMHETIGVQVLDLQQHELVWRDDYIADEYEIDGDEIVFASDNIVEVTELAFVEAVGQETPKNNQRLVHAMWCHYWGPNVLHHLHHGWTYQGERIGTNWFQCPDEAGEWHMFYAELTEKSFFTESVGTDWTTFEDEFILLPANELRIFDKKGHPTEIEPGSNRKKWRKHR